MLKTLICLFAIFFFISASHPFDESPLLSPVQEQASFVLEKGLKIELVASEPMIQDPVCINFDEKGRLWVVEMRGYMPDVEGNDELSKIGRVSVLEDINSDGQMDKSTVYLDSLVLPRALALIKGGILVVENQALWQCLDLNGDLKADTKTLIDKDYAGSGAPEHSGNGLLRNLDNWYYNAKSRFRYKNINNQWIKDSTEFRGQWGMSQDDKGRLHYNYNWSQLHADLVPPNTLGRNKNHLPSSGIDHGLTIDRRVYPIRETPAVNRGYIPGTLDKNNYLLEFTAACAPYVYREAALANDYFGNVFVCEPAGNLIKRNKIKENGLELIATDPNAGHEFLASTDERFRPVNLASGPDGALYVVDMYKGVIQHKLYETPYLKEQYAKRGLDKYLHKGRIWRIVPEKWQPIKNTKISESSSENLLKNLSSKNGWTRDMAQRILVENRDVSVVASLKKIIQTNNNTIGRLHAIWTLEGLNLLDTELLFHLAADPNTLISNNALRILYNSLRYDKKERERFQIIIQKIAINAPIDQALHLIICSEKLDNDFKFNVYSKFLIKYGKSIIIKDAVMSSLGNAEFQFLKYLNKSAFWKNQAADKEIFLEMLSTAIVKKGNTDELSEVLKLIDKNPDNWQEKAYLMAFSVQSNGILNPFKLNQQPLILTENNKKIDAYYFQKLSSMFEWPGHISKKIDKKNQIVLKPEEEKMFAKGRIQYLNTCSGCHGSDGKGIARFAPKLVGSEWVTGNDTRLVLIVLHGLEGAIKVDGKLYDAPEILPVMPAHSTLDDATITNILTYIRNEWGNNAGALSRGLVGKTRHTTQGRVIPWKSETLNTHIESLKDIK